MDLILGMHESRCVRRSPGGHRYRTRGGSSRSSLTCREGRRSTSRGASSPPDLETHIHLDKSCILDRCKAEKGDLEEAIGEVARAKTVFTPEDVYARGKRTLEQCILNGTTHMRTQLEVDPGIGLRGLQGPPLIDSTSGPSTSRSALPQEGLLNNLGTDALMVRPQDGRQRVWRCALHRTNPMSDRPHLRDGAPV